ncbi:hypothetical protein [Marinimicrobium sp. C2-29]|uniref:hypothetical protein n=1 Tax=Marinimicrobium sp. C2-29 TaxID=3139825 RepID=UPI0031392767
MTGSVRKTFMAVTVFLLSVCAVWGALSYVDRDPDRADFGEGSVDKLEEYKGANNVSDEEPKKSRKLDSVSSLEEKIEVEERRRESYVEGGCFALSRIIVERFG